jgi:hypothetical protein
MEQKSKFQDLTFYYPLFSVRCGRYVIPIKVKIENITYMPTQRLDASLQDDDDMGFEFQRNEELKMAKINLVHINVEDKLYANFTKNFLEYHELDSVEQVLDYIDYMDLYKLNNTINKTIPVMIKIFRDRLYNSLKLDIDPPQISYKPDKEQPPHIKEYLQFTENYIFLQSLIEFSPSPLYYENEGRTPDRWSMREYETRMAYITAKNRFESTENLWQLSSMKT